MAGATLRILTWNLFHGRDGLPGLGATCASTLLRRPVDDGVHVHLNRKLTGLMADRVRAWAPDLCALQEVPTAAVREIVARTGMLAVGRRPGRSSARAACATPWGRATPTSGARTRATPTCCWSARALSLVPGSERAVRLNPARAILRAAVDLDLGIRPLLRYLLEPRLAVIARAPHGRRRRDRARVRAPATTPPPGADRHGAGAGDGRLEGPRGGVPMVLAGDLNAPRRTGAGRRGGRGWSGAPAAAGAASTAS